MLLGTPPYDTRIRKNTSNVYRDGPADIVEGKLIGLRPMSVRESPTHRGQWLVTQALDLQEIDNRDLQRRLKLSREGLLVSGFLLVG